MRLATTIAVLVALAGPAGADAKLVKQYTGQIVISPDPAPTEASELAEYVRINVQKDGRYALIKGSPWTIHLVGFLTKDRGTGPVALVFTDVADRDAAPLHAIEVTAKNRLVISTATVTTAAGFVAGKTYLLRLVRGKATLARAELELRD
jgi:hypothetical protein